MLPSGVDDVSGMLVFGFRHRTTNRPRSRHSSPLPCSVRSVGQPLTCSVDRCVIEDPAASTDRSDRIGAENASDSDEKRIASPFTEVGQAGTPRKFLSSDDSAAGFHEDTENAQFLVGQ